MARWDTTSDKVSLVDIPWASPIVDPVDALTGGTASVKRALVSREWLLTDVGGYLGPRVWHMPTGRTWNVPEADISAFTVAGVGGTSPVLFAGTSEGHLLQARVEGEGMLELVPVAAGGHDGPITCVAAHNSAFVATGGVDRCVRIWQTAGEKVSVTPLYLTLRCAGARLDGTEGMRERSLLQTLAATDI